MRAVCIERCMHGSEGGVVQSRPDSMLLPYLFDGVPDKLGRQSRVQGKVGVHPQGNIILSQKQMREDFHPARVAVRVRQDRSEATDLPHSIGFQRAVGETDVRAVSVRSLYRWQAIIPTEHAGINNDSYRCFLWQRQQVSKHADPLSQNAIKRYMSLPQNQSKRIRDLPCCTRFLISSSHHSASGVVYLYCLEIFV